MNNEIMTHCDGLSLLVFSLTSQPNFVIWTCHGFESGTLAGIYIFKGFHFEIKGSEYDFCETVVSFKKTNEPSQKVFVHLSVCKTKLFIVFRENFKIRTE
jgi:hypothetical protein